MSSRPYVTPEPIPEASVDLRTYLSVIKGNRWLIALITAMCVGAAVAYVLLATPIYSASSTLQLQPVNVNPLQAGFAGLDKLIQPDTESQIATSLNVAQIAKDDMGSPVTPQELLKHVEAKVAQESTIMQIVFSDPNAKTAATGAQAFADAYLKYRGEQAKKIQNEQLGPIEERIASLENDLKGLEPGSAAYQAIESSILPEEANRQAILSTNVTAGSVISPPIVPSGPSSPRRNLTVAIGLFLGLFLGTGLAFLRVRTDTRVRERGDLEDALGAPVLAVIPRDTAWTDRSKPRLVTVQEPRSPAAEAYRTLRPSLLVAAAERGVKTIMVVSPAPGEGKSTTTANLGVTLAQADKRVVLVSADLRKARMHDFFGVKNHRGLTEVLQGRVPPWESLRRTPIDNLWLLPSGSVPENPAELLQSQAMRELLAEQRGVVDFLLLDCPPILPVADAIGLAPFVDGVLFVADAGTTTIDAAQQARAALDRVGANVIGSVLNDLDVAKASSYYGYGYGTAPAYNGGRSREAARRRKARS